MSIGKVLHKVKVFWADTLYPVSLDTCTPLGEVDVVGEVPTPHSHRPELGLGESVQPGRAADQQGRADITNCSAAWGLLALFSMVALKLIGFPCKGLPHVVSEMDLSVGGSQCRIAQVDLIRQAQVGQSEVGNPTQIEEHSVDFAVLKLSEGKLVHLLPVGIVPKRRALRSGRP